MSGQMTPPNSYFLDAFAGRNTRVPVWFMRQAGRYLPEYQAIRKSHTLDQMFRDPAIVAEVTLQPIHILKVDAAILFADILTLPIALGFDITFDPQRGPVIKNPVKGDDIFKQIHQLDDVPHIRAALPMINAGLPKEKPLIGFAGSPFTVLCYLIEGGGSTTFRSVIRMMNENPRLFHELMLFMTENTIAYLNLQKRSGIAAFQLFDSWGGILPQKVYDSLVLPYVQRIFREVELPSILYLKNSFHLLSSMLTSGADFISVCETVDLCDDQILPEAAEGRIGVQGNLWNGNLYAPDDVLRREVQKILQPSDRFKKYIFNLNHGIPPDAPVSKVQMIVDLVHQHKRAQ